MTKTKAYISAFEMDFLEDLFRLGGGATNSRIVRFVDRQEDCLRQQCRRSGWVEFAPVEGRVKGWRLTPLGYALVEVAKARPDLWKAVCAGQPDAEFLRLVEDREEQRKKA